MVSVTSARITYVVWGVLLLSMPACSIIQPKQQPEVKREPQAPITTPVQPQTQAPSQIPTRTPRIGTPVIGTRSVEPPRKPVPRVKSVHPAIAKLLRQALAQQQKGALEKSAATIERALRIRPSEALAWNRLAFVRLQQSQWRQAEQLALKSNSLAETRNSLIMRNWRIIADARQHQGNAIGAKAAQRHAKRLAH